MRLRLLLLPALAILLPPRPAEAWYEKTHAWIVRAALDAIERADERDRLYEELYTGEFRIELGRGAWREDFDPPVAGNSRAMRHYYDPRSPHLAKGVVYQHYFEAWPKADENEKIARPKGDLYDSALRWALDGSALRENPFHWAGAIEAHGQGTRGARREAYFRLGHVLHLLGDMAEPDHATNTVHAGSGKVLPLDAAEDALVAFSLEVLSRTLRSGLFAGADAEKVDALLKKGEAPLREVVREGLRRAVGPPDARAAMRLTGLEGLVEDGVTPDLVRDFFLGPEAPQLLAPPVKVPAPEAGSVPPPTHADFPRFFNDLAAFAEAKRPKSMALPIGCEDVRPLVREVLGILFASAPAVADALGSCRYMEAPIYLLPRINERDPDACAPFVAYGRLLLAEAVASTIALARHFHDVVNEPPYVKEVSIAQSRERSYWASWGEKDADERPTGRTEERYNGVPTDPSFIPATYLACDARALVRRAEKFLEPGRPADVRIVFGPAVSAGSREVPERIDPKSVRVSIDGKPVEGRMTGPNVWVGLFTPQLPAGAEPRTMAVVIEARDLHRHLLSREEGKAPGLGLDAKPATVARVKAELPDFGEADAHRRPPRYAWEGFEEGADRNHAFTVAPKDAEERAPPPRRSIAPDSTVLRVSGELDPGTVEKERARFAGRLDAKGPRATFTLRSDGAAAVTPETLEVRLESAPGRDGGWREIWIAALSPGKGHVSWSSGAAVVESVRETWTLVRGELRTASRRTGPKKAEWTAVHDGKGIYRLHLSGGWGPPHFLLSSAAEPESPERLAAQYLAWFDRGGGPGFDVVEMARIDGEFAGRGLHPATGVATLCAERRTLFLGDGKEPGAREFSARISALARHHLERESEADALRGAYLLQAVAASPMNAWGDKGHVPGWSDAALEKGVKAAPGWFPDAAEEGGFAGGIDLLGRGEGRVAALKKKYANRAPEPLFEGW